MLAIPGTGNPVHLTENIDAAALRLSPQEISSLAATPRPRTRIPATRRTKGRQSLRQATQALDAGQIRAARERGAAMTPASGVEYTIMMTGEHAQNPAAAPEPGRLSFRERELIALVVQGQTDAQIAGKLFITIRTVRSHLDRIRDKSGCRRRADLTRLTLREGTAPFRVLARKEGAL